MKDLFELMREKVLLYDGAKGVLLQEQGLKGDEAAEAWNASRPDIVRDAHRQYALAGSAVLQANTFTGNKVELTKYGLGHRVYELNFAGVRLAREAAGEGRFVSASVGPTGLFMEPAGELSFDEAYRVFREQLRAITDAGADFVNFESFMDIAELRAAILAAKENTALPILASMTFEKNNRTLMGNPAEVCAIVCQSLGASAVGANCSGGPDSLIGPITGMYSVASVPLAVKANAGLPKFDGGKTVFDQDPEQFAAYTQAFTKQGVRLIGGCCGTKPAHIQAVGRVLAGAGVPELRLKADNALASAFRFLPGADNGNHSFRAIDLMKQGIFDDIQRGDDDGAVEKILDNGGEDAAFLLLDFGGESIDPAALGGYRRFIPVFGASVRKPIVIRTASDALLETFLRYYPGRAGAACSEPSDKRLHLLRHYGALRLNLK